MKRIIILTGIPEEGIKYDGGTTRITYQNEFFWAIFKFNRS